MQTPDTKAGRMTETVMAAIKKKVPAFPAHIYNPTYSAVLDVMQAEFPETTTHNQYLPVDIAQEVLKNR